MELITYECPLRFIRQKLVCLHLVSEIRLELLSVLGLAQYVGG